MNWTAYALPVVLLLASNVFMTVAWYGHLKYPAMPMTMAIIASWGIAFIEYCLAVPANRIGYNVYSAAELKTIQEVITLMVFVGFAAVVLKEKINIMHVVGFAVMAVGAAIVFYAKGRV